MAKFIFPLDGVLRQRKLVEEQRQRELGSVQAEFSALEAELRELDRTVSAASADVRDNHLLGPLNLSYLAAHRRYAAAMQRKAIGIAEKMAAVKLRVDSARRALVEAATQRKVIEKLRENRKSQWAEQISRKELAELDEIGSRIGRREA